jgi:hypothetical protein
VILFIILFLKKVILSTAFTRGGSKIVSSVKGKGRNFTMQNRRLFNKTAMIMEAFN